MASWPLFFPFKRLLTFGDLFFSLKNYSPAPFHDACNDQVHSPNDGSARVRAPATSPSLLALPQQERKRRAAPRPPRDTPKSRGGGGAARPRPKYLLHPASVVVAAAGGSHDTTRWRAAGPSRSTPSPLPLPAPGLAPTGSALPPCACGAAPPRATGRSCPRRPFSRPSLR